MKLSPVITALRARCPSLQRRVGGAAEFASIEQNTALAMPCAFVVPLGESAESFPTGRMEMDYRQQIQQNIAVILFVDTSSQRRGQDAYDAVEDLKFEVLKAIAGSDTPDTDAMVYDGMSILDMNKARLAIQMEFYVTYDIVDEQTAHGVDLANLPDFEGMDVTVDQIIPDGKDTVKFLVNLKEEEA